MRHDEPRRRRRRRRSYSDSKSEQPVCRAKCTSMCKLYNQLVFALAKELWSLIPPPPPCASGLIPPPEEEETSSSLGQKVAPQPSELVSLSVMVWKTETLC